LEWWSLLKRLNEAYKSQIIFLYEYLKPEPGLFFFFGFRFQVSGVWCQEKEDREEKSEVR
jgi:hypothetical protein